MRQRVYKRALQRTHNARSTRVEWKVNAPVTAEERWADLAGACGYRVSDRSEIVGVERRARTNNGLGESTRRVPAHLMSQSLRNGRCTVRLCVDGVPRTVGVADAVLEAFRGPRPRGYIAEHVNGDPRDCRLCNLRWARRVPANSSKLDTDDLPPQQTPTMVTVTTVALHRRSSEAQSSGYPGRDLSLDGTVISSTPQTGRVWPV